MMPPFSQFPSRTLHLLGEVTGTGFVIENNDKQFLVTADHLLGKKDSKDLKIRYLNGWTNFPCEIHARCSKLDIAVLNMPILLEVKNNPIEFDMSELLWGQHVWFLGFPLGISNSFDFHYEGKLPHPYVKWAALSSPDFGDDHQSFTLDGQNNPGFSGGPVGFTTIAGKQRVAGIVTGFREETNFVQPFSESKLDEKLVYNTNSGLIRAAKANDILALISSEL